MVLSIETRVSRLIASIRKKDELAYLIRLTQLKNDGISDEMIFAYIDKQVEKEKEEKLKMKIE